MLTVILPAAQGKTFPLRLRVALGEVLRGLGVDEGLISAELQHFTDHTFTKTNNRSVLGSLKEFVLIGSHWIDSTDPAHLLRVSLKMATVPCTPLVETFPDRAVHALFAA